MAPQLSKMMTPHGVNKKMLRIAGGATIAAQVVAGATLTKNPDLSSAEVALKKVKDSAFGGKASSAPKAKRQLNAATCTDTQMTCTLPDTWSGFDYHPPTALKVNNGDAGADPFELQTDWDPLAGQDGSNVDANGNPIDAAGYLVACKKVGETDTSTTSLPTGMSAPNGAGSGSFTFDYQQCGATRTYTDDGNGNTITIVDSITLKVSKATRDTYTAQEQSNAATAQYLANTDAGGVTINFADETASSGGTITITQPPDIVCTCTTDVTKVEDQTPVGGITLEEADPVNVIDGGQTGNVGQNGAGNAAATLAVFSDSGYTTNILGASNSIPAGIFQFYVQMSTSYTNQRVTIKDCDVSADAADFAKQDAVDGGDNSNLPVSLVPVIDNYCEFDNTGAAPFGVTYPPVPGTTSEHRVQFKKFKFASSTTIFMRCKIAICDASNSECGTCSGRRMLRGGENKKFSEVANVKTETVMWNVKNGEARKLQDGDDTVPGEAASTPLQIQILTQGSTESTTAPPGGSNTVVVVPQDPNNQNPGTNGQPLNNNTGNNTTSSDDSSMSTLIIALCASLTAAFALAMGCAYLGWRKSTLLTMQPHTSMRREGSLKGQNVGPKGTVTPIQDFNDCEDVVAADKMAANNKNAEGFRMEEFKEFARELIPGIIDATAKATKGETNSNSGATVSTDGASDRMALGFGDDSSVGTDPSTAAARELEAERVNLQRQHEQQVKNNEAKLAEERKVLADENRRLEEHLHREKLEAEKMKAHAEVALMKAEAEQEVSKNRAAAAQAQAQAAQAQAQVVAQQQAQAQQVAAQQVAVQQQQPPVVNNYYTQPQSPAAAAAPAAPVVQPVAAASHPQRLSGHTAAAPVKNTMNANYGNGWKNGRWTSEMDQFSNSEDAMIDARLNARIEETERRMRAQGRM